MIEGRGGGLVTGDMSLDEMIKISCYKMRGDELGKLHDDVSGGWGRWLWLLEVHMCYIHCM